MSLSNVCRTGLKSRFCAIIGSQWGDEGKGKLTDILAEKYDGNWRLLVNNKTAPLSKSIIGEPTFDVVESGNLYLEHDGTKRRALTSIQGIIFLSVLVLALPAGRRRKEMVEL